MNCAVHRLNTLLHTMDGHCVIRNNSLFIYDEEDQLDLFIPSYLLQLPSPNSDHLLKRIRKMLLTSSD